MSDKETKNLGEEIIKEICKIYDPEIPVNIYELGLISVSYTHLTLPTKA